MYVSRPRLFCISAGRQGPGVCGGGCGSGGRVTQMHACVYVYACALSLSHAPTHPQHTNTNTQDWMKFLADGHAAAKGHGDEASLMTSTQQLRMGGKGAEQAMPHKIVSSRY
jgi:hypothetical protein|eukprot:Tamp_34076.p2 GENE.Tamp_34076~~Tamp_34076.p2  ORF type:complete len:112 (+),score=10.11 Tamp_34076:237-572(+)